MSYTQRFCCQYHQRMCFAQHTIPEPLISLETDSNTPMFQRPEVINTPSLQYESPLQRFSVFDNPRSHNDDNDVSFNGLPPVEEQNLNHIFDLQSWVPAMGGVESVHAQPLQTQAFHEEPTELALSPSELEMKIT
ncbi:hypothetical protein F5Y17DRAFT_476188 [Xylariaceae sp. FL0594]|nr:hypothetical protein F5Y17DRAFT_476188 [Xylariaceae sp. FL0594]